MSDRASIASERPTKQVVVMLTEAEHSRLEVMARQQRRTMGQQLAYLAWRSPEARAAAKKQES